MVCNGRFCCGSISQASSSILVLDCLRALDLEKPAVARNFRDGADWLERGAHSSPTRPANLLSIFRALHDSRYTEAPRLAESDPPKCGESFYWARSCEARICAVPCRRCVGSLLLASVQARVAVA